MDENNVIEKLGTIGDLSSEEAKEIPKHVVSTDSLPMEVFNELYWTIIPNTKEVLKDFVGEYLLTNREEESSGMDDTEFPPSNWEEYLGKAINRYAEQNNLILIIQGEHLIFANKDLVEKGYIIR